MPLLPKPERVDQGLYSEWITAGIEIEPVQATLFIPDNLRPTCPICSEMNGFGWKMKSTTTLFFEPCHAREKLPEPIYHQ